MFLLSLWWFLGSFALGFSYHFPFLEHIPSKGTFHSIDVLWDDHPTHHEDVSGKMKVQTDVFLVYACGVCKGNPQNSFTSSSTLELNINHVDGIYPMLVVVASYSYHSKKHINCGIPVIILVYQRIRSLKRTAVPPFENRPKTTQKGKDRHGSSSHHPTFKCNHRFPVVKSTSRS